MLDVIVHRIADPMLERCAAVLVRRRVTANALTVAGFVCGLTAMLALWQQAYGVALVCWGLNRLADGLDGPVARLVAGTSEGTPLGAYLDIVLDFIVYAGFVFAFAMGRPDVMGHAAFLLFSFMGTGTSFLAYAIVSAKIGQTNPRKKGFFYLGGLAEGTETALAFALMCLFPDHFTTIALVFAAMCWITTATRIAQAVTDFRRRPAA